MQLQCYKFHILLLEFSQSRYDYGEIHLKSTWRHWSKNSPVSIETSDIQDLLCKTMSIINSLNIVHVDLIPKKRFWQKRQILLLQFLRKDWKFCFIFDHILSTDTGQVMMRNFSPINALENSRVLFIFQSKCIKTPTDHSTNAFFTSCLTFNQFDIIAIKRAWG